MNALISLFVGKKSVFVVISLIKLSLSKIAEFVLIHTLDLTIRNTTPKTEV